MEARAVALTVQKKSLASIFIQVDFSNHSENIHNGVREETTYKLAQALTLQI